MDIIIHRGANQIGGCVTEISTEGAKIFIDLGANLPGGPGKELDVENVRKITKGADAIFYTHYHGDHVGLFPFVPEAIPQYIGKGAQEVMLCKYEALNKHYDQAKELNALRRFRNYRTLVPIDINGKIRVTPYFVSHSAFDAYMFKIEVEGKTIFHTGDFRSHGYLGKGLKPTLLRQQGNIDFLIIEGTMLGRQGERLIREYDIMRNTKDFLRGHKYVFALCSSTDRDRLASFHAACKATGRVFLCDRYQKSVLDIFTRYAWKGSDLFKFEDAFVLIDYKRESVYTKLSRQGFLMLVRASQKDLIKSMLEVYSDEPATLIYSMWQGYYNGSAEQVNPDIVRIRQLFGNRIKDGVSDGFHTSGHADVEALQMVCRILKPRLGIIPIHKDASATYRKLDIAKEYRIIESSERLDGITIFI